MHLNSSNSRQVSLTKQQIKTSAQKVYQQCKSDHYMPAQTIKVKQIIVASASIIWGDD